MTLFGMAGVESLIRQLQGMLGGNRVVRGVVNVVAGTPTILEGTGFTITDNGVGDFTINFDPAFSDRPSVSVMTLAGAGGVVEAGTSPASGAAIRILVFLSTTGATVDVGFHFVAVGPS